MIKEKIINIEFNVTLTQWQPGNGTRYIVIFTQLDQQACEMVGAPAGSWLVSRLESRNNRTYPFAPDEFLTYSYIMEKMDCNQVDASELTKIIGKFLNRPTRVVTDESGRWLGEDKYIDSPE